MLHTIPMEMATGLRCMMCSILFKTGLILVFRAEKCSINTCTIQKINIMALLD